MFFIGARTLHIARLVPCRRTYSTWWEPVAVHPPPHGAQGVGKAQVGWGHLSRNAVLEGDSPCGWVGTYSALYSHLSTHQSTKLWNALASFRAPRWHRSEKRGTSVRMVRHSELANLHGHHGLPFSVVTIEAGNR